MRILTMAEGEPATGITGRGPTQRVKTYIVISKPKRISVKPGFVHIMGALRGGLKTGST
jgi:hypothetical protein